MFGTNAPPHSQLFFHLPLLRPVVLDNLVQRSQKRQVGKRQYSNPRVSFPARPA